MQLKHAVQHHDVLIVVVIVSVIVEPMVLLVPLLKQSWPFLLLSQSLSFCYRYHY